MQGRNLVLQTVLVTVITVIVLGALLFIPAGTLAYWQGWLFILVFTVSTTAIGLYLSMKDPALLERRKQAGPTAEQRPAQRIIISLFLLGYLGMMVFSALDYRFVWSTMPWFVSVLGDVLVALGLYITLLVMQENTYAASNIQVVEGQQVISTGPYAVVRHPMYTGGLIMSLGTPLALGSWWGLLWVVVLTPVLMWRILDEEQLLRTELPGYPDYMQAVRHRLVPSVW